MFWNVLREKTINFFLVPDSALAFGQPWGADQTSDQTADRWIFPQRRNIENLRGNPSPGIACFIRINDFDSEQGIHKLVYWTRHVKSVYISASQELAQNFAKRYK